MHACSGDWGRIAATGADLHPLRVLTPERLQRQDLPLGDLQPVLAAAQVGDEEAVVEPVRPSLLRLRLQAGAQVRDRLGPGRWLGRLVELLPCHLCQLLRQLVRHRCGRVACAAAR